MLKAVCISCGTSKSAPWKTCTCCGFNPSTTRNNLIKSIYLSDGRYIGRKVEGTPDIQKELFIAQNILKSGQEIEYDEAKLLEIAKFANEFERVPPSAVWGAVFRSFAPGLAFLGIMLLLWLLLAMLNRFMK
ncbi:MAG TPA: hypothetical protein VHD56_08600 [Tepidisphaeraceae bacterium]|nr:hypothetical protein [Tepidisphaeraceae bacterium]